MTKKDNTAEAAENVATRVSRRTAFKTAGTLAGAAAAGVALLGHHIDVLGKFPSTIDRSGGFPLRRP